MTDERLAAIRAVLNDSRWGEPEDFLFAMELANEVERLRSVVDEYKEVIKYHHADFVKIKEWCHRGLTPCADPPEAVVASEALREIDRIVR